MIALACDENFNNDILRGLLRRKSGVDIVCIQDVGLRGASDPTVLEWAAKENRILLTHDVSTMTRYALERINAGLPMPGIFQINRSAKSGTIIEDLLLILECSNLREWDNRIFYIPLK